MIPVRGSSGRIKRIEYRICSTCGSKHIVPNQGDKKRARESKRLLEKYGSTPIVLDPEQQALIDMIDAEMKRSDQWAKDQGYGSIQEMNDELRKRGDVFDADGMITDCEEDLIHPAVKSFSVMSEYLPDGCTLDDLPVILAEARAWREMLSMRSMGDSLAIETAESMIEIFSKADFALDWSAQIE